MTKCVEIREIAGEIARSVVPQYRNRIRLGPENTGRRQIAPIGLAMSLDIRDDILDGFNLLSVLVGDFHLVFFFEGHD